MCFEFLFKVSLARVSNFYFLFFIQMTNFSVKNNKMTILRVIEFSTQNSCLAQTKTDARARGLSKAFYVLFFFFHFNLFFFTPNPTPISGLIHGAGFI